MTIRLLALDVDGTLTDGGVYMNGQGGEFKRFDIRDGMGIVRLKKAGVEIALISGRHSAATEQRARDLGITRLHNGVADKILRREFPVDDDAARMGVREEGVDSVAGGQRLDDGKILTF